MATDESLYVRRFSVAERTIHWVHVGAFAGLLATGIALYLPALAGALGSRQALKAIHLAIASGWAAVLLAIVASSDRAALRRTALEVERFDADDLQWLRRRPAPQGRFNAGQKLHAVAQAAFAALFVISGLLLLLGEGDTRLRLPGTIILHDGLTVLASGLVAVHVFLAVVWPTTRPALRGMVRGSVRRDWAAAHHAKWLRAPAEHPDGAPQWRSAMTWALIAGAVGLAALSLSALG